MIGALVSRAAMLAALAGLIVFLISAPRRELWRVGVPLTLDFWTAATLLALIANPGWTQLASVAAITGVQSLLTMSAPKT